MKTNSFTKHIQPKLTPGQIESVREYLREIRENDLMPCVDEGLTDQSNRELIAQLAQINRLIEDFALEESPK